GALPGAPLSFCRRPREWHACRGALRLSANADAFIGALPEQPPALPTSARGYRLVGRDDQPSSRYALNGSTARAIGSFFGANALGRLTEDGDSHPGISGRASTGMTPADTIRFTKTSCSQCWSCRTVETHLDTLEDVFVRLKPKADALDVDELDVGHAEKAEYGLQIGSRVVHWGGGATIRVDALRSKDHIDLLTLDQAFRAALGIAESLARTRHIVEPGL